MSAAQEHYEAALEALQNDSPVDALGHLGSGFVADVTYKPLYEVARDSLNAMESPTEAAFFQAALDNFEAFEPMYNLGYYFIEVQQYRIAVPFLKRALEIQPYEKDVAYELSFAYGQLFQTEAALNVLENVDITGDFWTAFQYFSLSILNEKPHPEMEDMIQAVREQIMNSEPEDQEDEQMREVVWERLNELEEVKARLVHIGEPAAMIRDWHFIQYGSAILSFFDELDVAGGRFVYSWGNEEEVRNVLERLKRYLTQFNRLPEKVVAIRDRNAGILGRSMAKILDVPFEFWDERKHASAANCLIMAGRTQDLNEVPALKIVQEGQTVFAYSLAWMDNHFICPDVVGSMHQMYSFPWEEGRLRVDAELNEVESMDADDRPEAEIVQEILKQEIVLDEEDWEEDIAFYKAHFALSRLGEESSNTRIPFWIKSPVAGSYFF